MAPKVHHIVVPSSTQHLDDVRQFVETHAQAAQLSRKDVDHFKVAVDEACTNVIKHAYHSEENHEIDIAVIIDNERFTVRIRDEGETFDRSEYTQPDLTQLVKQRRRGGLGVELMHRLMDEVNYRTDGPINEVQLIKYRNGQ